MKAKHGQTSLEFLYSVGLMLLIFILIALIFYQSQTDATNLSIDAESRRVCQLVSSQISAVFSSGHGTAANLDLPALIAGKNYSVYVNGLNRSVSVSYGTRGTGCHFLTSNVTNGSSTSFFIGENSTVENVEGGVVIG